MSKTLILYEGQTLDELRKDFEDGIDSYLEGCRADCVEPAKPNSGRLNLRMSSELHSRVAAFVQASGTTINDFINKAIKDELKRVAVLLVAWNVPSNKRPVRVVMMRRQSCLSIAYLLGWDCK